MDEEIKKKLQELEDRIDDLESQIEEVTKYADAHKHNQGDGYPTMNY